MNTHRPRLLQTLAIAAALVGTSAQLLAIDHLAQSRSVASHVVELPRVVVKAQRADTAPALARQARRDTAQPG